MVTKNEWFSVKTVKTTDLSKNLTVLDGAITIKSALAATSTVDTGKRKRNLINRT